MPLSRRQVLATAAVAAAGIAAGGCDRRPGRGRVGPSSSAVQATEARRRRVGAPVREVALTAAPVTLELAGRPVTTWAYNGSVPGPLVRVRAGEVLRARLDNRLPEATTIHWHGVALRNDMDGVPGVTQPPVQPGGHFTYEFTVPAPGTYFFHPHVGVQLDRGLYAALVVEDPDEPGRYDREAVVVLDDWTDGLGPSPAAIMASLQRSGGMSMDAIMQAMTGPAAGGPLGGAGGEVAYPRYLLNGRPPEDPATLAARPGQRLRLRLVNAAADTAFRVALGGHRLQVTHSDGYPLDPVTVDTLVMGMGERYDLLVDLQEGVFPLVAVAEGKRGQARGLLRAGRGTPPPARARPTELDGRLLDPARLRADPSVALPQRSPARTHRLTLSGGMGEFRWTINGRTFDPDRPLPLRAGERTRLVFENPSMMFHPMHLHGHTFAVQHPTGSGPRKDTVIVAPMQRLAVDLDADNPGQWVVHCHNLYHMEAGMMTSLAYLA
jgi:FtsP/CotA-like multicopper oxidase with cupredoxin domain